MFASSYVNFVITDMILWREVTRTIFSTFQYNIFFIAIFSFNNKNNHLLAHNSVKDSYLILFDFNPLFAHVYMVSGILISY